RYSKRKDVRSAIERERTHGRRTQDVGQRAHSFDEAVIDLLVPGGTAPRKTDVDREHAAGVEPRIDPGRVADALEHEQRAGREYEGERDRQGDESAAGAPPRGSCRRARAERGRTALGEPYERRAAEECRTDGRKHGAEGDRPGTDRHLP